MPLHIQPSLRAREEALEQAGLLATQNSQGVTNALAAEASGVAAKVVPATYYQFVNVKYQAK